MQFWKHSSA